MTNHSRLEVEQIIATGDGAEGFIQIAPSIIAKYCVAGHRVCCVKMSDSREEFRAGDIGLIDIDAEVVSGDRVLVTNQFSWAIYRAVQTEDGWTLNPLGRSPLQPWFVDKLDGYVVGKLIKVFSRGEIKRDESEDAGLSRL